MPRYINSFRLMGRSEKEAVERMKENAKESGIENVTLWYVDDDSICGASGLFWPQDIKREKVVYRGATS